MRINQPHTKTYFAYFDLPPDLSIFVACELCGSTANDIHHIDARGMGGTDHDYDIDELMALCSKHHIEFGDITEHKIFLLCAHQTFIRQYKMSHKDYEYEFCKTFKFPLR